MLVLQVVRFRFELTLPTTPSTAVISSFIGRLVGRVIVKSLAFLYVGGVAGRFGWRAFTTDKVWWFRSVICIHIYGKLLLTVFFCRLAFVCCRAFPRIEPISDTVQKSCSDLGLVVSEASSCFVCVRSMDYYTSGMT